MFDDGSDLPTPFEDYLTSLSSIFPASSPLLYDLALAILAPFLYPLVRISQCGGLTPVLIPPFREYICSPVFFFFLDIPGIDQQVFTQHWSSFLYLSSPLPKFLIGIFFCSKEACGHRLPCILFGLCRFALSLCLPPYASPEAFLRPALVS